MHNLKKLTDDELVAAYAKGNNEAFDTLLARHQQQVFSYILRVVRSRDVADDIFQETFVKAITNIRQGRYTDNGKFPAWINRIAHNLIIDHFRQEKAENTTSADDAPVDLLNRLDLAERNIEDSIVDRQLRDDIRSIILKLPPSQKQVLVMRYYRNMSFKEIAAATGVSINTALGRMRYAMINMRRLARESNVCLTV